MAVDDSQAEAGPTEQREGPGEGGDVAASACCASEEGDLGEEPTDERLLEAVRDLPASVKDVSLLTMNQVCKICMYREHARALF